MKFFLKPKKVKNLWRILEGTEIGFTPNTTLYERLNNHYELLFERNQILEKEEFDRLKNLYRKGKVYVR